MFLQTVPLAALATSNALINCTTPFPPLKRSSVTRKPSAGVLLGTLGWTAFRLTKTATTIASREWQLIKHDIEEFVTPAWVSQEKQRAEYLTRIARAERRMGRVRHVCREKLQRVNYGEGGRGQGGVAKAAPIHIDFTFMTD